MYPIVSENEKLRVKEEYVTMEDGIRLYTRSVIPKGAEKAPIVYIRTPYEKAHNGTPHNPEAYQDDLYIQSGYAIVLQHCRGTGDSEGICIPYNEKEDGLKTLEYIRKLPFYNGEIYLRGGSYLSTVHLSYLETKPADIKGAVLEIQTDRMYFRNYRNGCNYNFCNLEWWLGMMKRQYPNPNLEGTVKRPFEDLMNRIVGEDVPQYRANLLNDTYNEFWRSDSRTYASENIHFPVLFTEGWYDFYIEGMFSMWERLQPETRKKSAMIVGPWGHATAVSPKAEYPLEHGNIPADYGVEWFNSIRENKPYKYAKVNKVNYYSIGGDFWKDAEYPVQKKNKIRLYFNTDAENLRDNTMLTYQYDPEKKVDCFKYHNIYKAHEMNTVDGVLSFRSGEFTEEKAFFGEIRWHMSVSSDCEDTAFFMRVYLTENGISYNLTETITSLSYICKDYKPGTKITIDLKTPPIAFTVKPGTRIRVDIASDGGIYVPHANVKGHWAQVSECKVANNSVYLDDFFIEM